MPYDVHKGRMMRGHLISHLFYFAAISSMGLYSVVFSNYAKESKSSFKQGGAGRNVAVANV